MVSTIHTALVVAAIIAVGLLLLAAVCVLLSRADEADPGSAHEPWEDGHLDELASITAELRAVTITPGSDDVQGGRHGEDTIGWHVGPDWMPAIGGRLQAALYEDTQAWPVVSAA